MVSDRADGPIILKEWLWPAQVRRTNPASITRVKTAGIDA